MRRIRLTLDVLPSANDILDGLATKRGQTKAEVLRLGIGLVKIMVETQEQGRHLGLFDRNDRLVRELVLA